MPTTGLFPKPFGKIVDRFLAHNLAEDVTPNASAATGYNVEYSGVGQLRTAKVTFTNYSLTITDATTAGAHGTLKLFDFPQARVRLVGIGYDLDMTAGSGGISDTAALVWSIGTEAVGTNNATLLTTEADIVASVAATLVGGTKNSTGTTSGNTIAALTDNSGGTASDTLAAITGSYVEATIENTVASLAAKINALIPLVNGVLDGTSAAKSAHLNVAIPDAGMTDGVNDTLTISGTILFHWINEGAPAV